jgi:hypothetical protein
VIVRRWIDDGTSHVCHVEFETADVLGSDQIVTLLAKLPRLTIVKAPHARLGQHERIKERLPMCDFQPY